MRPRSTVRATYDRLSPVYARLSDSSERQLSQEALAHLLRPRPGETVLEVGCGTGRVLVEIAERMGPDGRVVGVDLSGRMARQGRRRVMHAARAAQAAVLQSDAVDLPLIDRGVDAVFMSFTLELFDDDEVGSVLAQIRRVLTPQGRLCLVCMASTGSVWPMGQLYRWAHARAPSVVDCRPIDPVVCLNPAGFTITQRRQRSMWGLAVDLVLAVPAADPPHRHPPEQAPPGQDRG